MYVTKPLKSKEQKWYMEPQRILVCGALTNPMLMPCLAREGGRERKEAAIDFKKYIKY